MGMGLDMVLVERVVHRYAYDWEPDQSLEPGSWIYPSVERMVGLTKLTLPAKILLLQIETTVQ